MTNRQQGIRFVSIRSNRVESTTFSTHPQSSDALYLLSLAQMDFWYDESTARDTIRVDSCRIDNIFNPPSKPRCAILFKSRLNRLPVWRIDSKGYDSCWFDRIMSNRQYFQPTLQSPDALYLLSLAQMHFRYDESTARDTIRVESTTFSTHPQSPDALYLLSLAQIDFRYDESTARDTIRVDLVESCRIDNIFNPPSKPRCAILFKSRLNGFPVWRIDSKGYDFCRIDNIFNPSSKPRCAIFTKSHANRYPVWRIDSKGHDSSRFDQIVSNRQHFQPTLQSPDALYFLSLAQIDFWYDESTPRDTIRVDLIKSCRFNRVVSKRQHFQPTLKAQMSYIY